MLNSNYFSFYKGVLFIRHIIPDMTSCGLPNVVFLNKSEIANDDESIVTVKHEYGHTQQAKELGVINYIFFIAQSSVKGYKSSIHGADYYRQPWEFDADMRGGVNRGTSANPYYNFASAEAAQVYFDSIKP